MAKRKAIVPDGMENVHDQFHFAPGVHMAKTLDCSRQLRSTPRGTLDPDPAALISQAFENLRSVLEAAGPPWRMSSK